MSLSVRLTKRHPKVSGGENQYISPPSLKYTILPTFLEGGIYGEVVTVITGVLWDADCLLCARVSIWMFATDRFPFQYLRFRHIPGPPRPEPLEGV